MKTRLITFLFGALIALPSYAQDLRSIALKIIKDHPIEQSEPQHFTTVFQNKKTLQLRANIGEEGSHCYDCPMAQQRRPSEISHCPCLSHSSRDERWRAFVLLSFPQKQHTKANKYPNQSTLPLTTHARRGDAFLEKWHGHTQRGDYLAKCL